MKKKISIKILKALQPQDNSRLSLAKLVYDNDCLLTLIDIDSSSDFTFKIIKSELRQGIIHYQVTMAPTSEENLSSLTNWFIEDGVVNLLNAWLRILETYEKLKTVFDDPILISSQKQFEEEFALTDEDADWAPFEWQKMIFLDNYLQTVLDKLLLIQEQTDPEKNNDLQVILTEVSETRQALATESKNKIIKRLAKIWAKAKLHGIDIFKDIFVNVAAEITTRLITGK